MTRPSDGLAQELRERIDALEQHLAVWTQQPGCAVLGRGFTEELAKLRPLAERLQQREAFYREIVELAMEGIWMLDAEARTSFVNARMAELMGIEPEAMIGCSLFDFMAPEDMAVAEQKFSDRRNGLGERHDFRFVRPDGSDFWAELATKPLFDEERKFLGSLGMMTDITSRRETEAALRSLNEDLEARVAARIQDQQRLVFAMDSTREGMALLGSGRYIYINASHAAMHGYQPEELMGQSWQRLYCPEQVAWFQAEVFPAVLRDRSWAGEAVGRRKDGSRFDVEVSLTLMPSGEFVSTCRDITKRKRTEAALQESEERMQQALRVSHSFTFEWNLGTDNVVRSASCGAVLKLSGNDAIYDQGQIYFQRVHPDDRERFVQIVRALTPDSNGYVTEYRVRCGDGSVAVLEEVAQASFNDMGEMIRLVGVATDITERKRVEEALRESEKRLSLALDSGQMGLWEWDVETNRSIWNAKEYELLGLPVDEGDVVSDRFFRLVHPDDAPRLQASLTAILKSGGDWRDECRILRPDGEERWLAGLGRVIRTPEGRPRKMIGINYDITERRRLEQALADAKHAAEAANEAKSRFLANMSHEIRTPLNGILGLAHLLRRDSVTPLHVRQLEDIDAAGRHLLEIIDDILDLSKIEAGMLTLAEHDFQLPDLLASLPAITDQIAAKGLAFTVDLEGVPQNLRGDATRLRQVFLNYLSNAVKFTHKGAISLKGEVIEATPTNVLVRFTVADTGPGLTPEQQAELFNPFVQLESGLTRKHGGTGLGLAITRRLAELMQGTAGLDSVPGQGSRFWFTARLAYALGDTPRPAANPNSELALRQEFRGTRILVVEDDPISQEVASMLLDDVGLVTDRASSGREALVRLEEGTYALILMDMQMPEMDGLETTRRLRALSGYQNRPVIALTANAYAGDREACLRAGMNDFLTKPLEPERLFETVLTWLRSTI